MRRAYSVPYPKVPDATITGFRRISGNLAFAPISTVRSTAPRLVGSDAITRFSWILNLRAPEDAMDIEHGAVGADPLRPSRGLDHASKTYTHCATHALFHCNLCWLLWRPRAQDARQRGHHRQRPARKDCIGPFNALGHQVGNQPVIARSSIISRHEVLDLFRQLA